jgi:hypothetical protein
MFGGVEQQIHAFFSSVAPPLGTPDGPRDTVYSSLAVFVCRGLGDAPPERRCTWNQFTSVERKGAAYSIPSGFPARCLRNHIM